MGRPLKEGFPEWNPQIHTASKFGSSSFKVRYKALRNSSSAFIKRRDVREYIFNICGQKCSICEKEEKLQIDHIVSVYRCAKGELDINILNTVENLQPLCSSCNARKAP